MENNVKINYSKINKSIKTVDSINELLNSVDLVSYFESMENFFKELNFEHANCINYKESFDIIYSDIDKIKKMIEDLQISLLNISSTNREEVENDNDKKDGFFNSLSAKIDINELDIKDTIPIQNTTENPETSYDNGFGINTVPIGVAIGTAGVIGSIGTVALNEIYDKSKNKPKKKDEYNKYDVSETFNNDDDYKSMLSDDYFGNATLLSGQAQPYVANRSSRATDVVLFDDQEETKLPDFEDEDDEDDSDN